MVSSQVVSSAKIQCATVGSCAVQCGTGRATSKQFWVVRAPAATLLPRRLPAPRTALHSGTRKVELSLLGASSNAVSAPPCHDLQPFHPEVANSHCSHHVSVARTSKATGSLGWPALDKNALPPVRFLGSGVFGHVFLSDDPQYTEPVAVKMVDKTMIVDGHAHCQRTRLQKEARMLESLRDVPNVVQLKGLFEDERYGYIAMEVCDGGDMEGYLEGSPGPMPEKKAASFFAQMLRAVTQLHDRGICYGDIKPANFLLKTARGPDTHGLDLTVKLADFGCSQEYSDVDFLTQRTGTPLYTAPEVYLGRYSQAADLWGMGMILYRMLSGVFPFRPDLDRMAPYAMMMSVLNDELSLEGEEWSGVSCEAKDLVCQLLQRCVENRSTAAAALAHPWLRKYGCSACQLVNITEPSQVPMKDPALPAV